MKTLITGAGGFIGKYLIEHLLKEHPGEELVVVDRGTSPSPPGVTSLVCDLADPEAALKLMDDVKPDRIFHLAGTSRVTDEIDFPQYFRSNFLTTTSLLEALRGRRVTLFLASSVHVYGSQEHTVTEESEVHPNSPYAYTKYLAERAAEEAANTEAGLTVVVGRLYSCIGPDQGPGFVASDLCRKVAQLTPGETLKTGPLSAYRRFLDVRDLAGILDQLTRLKPVRRYQVVNVASPHELSIEAMLEEILRVAGVQPAVESAPDTGNPFRGLQIKTDRLQGLLEELTFRPIQATLRDMYLKTLENLPGKGHGE